MRLGSARRGLQPSKRPPRVASRHPCSEDLLAALGAGLVLLEQVVADGLGVNNLKVTLRQGYSESEAGFYNHALASAWQVAVLRNPADRPAQGNHLSAEDLESQARGPSDVSCRMS